MNLNPLYDGLTLRKYRYTYSESDQFIATFLIQRYNEVAEAWLDRQKLSYNPAFAREAVDEFARALVQRSSEIKRIGGSPLYQKQINGLEGGVDRKCSSMDSFNALNVIGELMAMGSVGIYVDNDPVTPTTLADQTRPYIYPYKAEDILNWYYKDGNLQSLLLRDWVEELDEYGLPSYRKFNYRLLRLLDGKVKVTMFDTSNTQTSSVDLDLETIPFVHLTLPHSLLKDTANYQIALLNAASAGIYQVWASNFPLYTQQYTNFSDLMKGAKVNKTAPEDTTDERKIQLGTTTGVQYPLGTERPAWIHPSSEPLKASQSYMTQLKEEIRQLTALAITNLTTSASAESKVQDRLGLESGLSVIGMTLQTGENRLSKIWHEYKGGKPAEIHYPEKYELLGEAERRENAKELKDLQHAVPSRIFQKETAKVIATTLHGHRVPNTTLLEMHDEIEQSPVPTADPEVLKADHEAGFVSDETASIGRGYKKGEATKAREDHALRIARIQAAQASEKVPTGNDTENKTNAGARGVKDLDTNPGQAAKDEKTLTQDSTKTDTGKKPVRGKA